MPDALVEARAREMWDQMLHSLSHQGIDRATPTCRSPAAPRRRSSSEAKPDAEQALRREAVLAAIVEAEGIEPTEEEMLEARRASAARPSSVEPEKLLERAARPAGAWTALKDDLAQRKALDLIAESREADLGRAGRRRARSSGRPGRTGQHDPRAGAPGVRAALLGWLGRRAGC